MSVPVFRLTQQRDGRIKRSATYPLSALKATVAPPGVNTRPPKKARQKKREPRRDVDPEVMAELTRKRRKFRKDARDAADILAPQGPQFAGSIPDPTRIRGILGQITPEQARVERLRRDTEAAIQRANTEQADLARALAADANAQRAREAENTRIALGEEGQRQRDVMQLEARRNRISNRNLSRATNAGIRNVADNITAASNANIMQHEASRRAAAQDAEAGRTLAEELARRQRDQNETLATRGTRSIVDEMIAQHTMDRADLALTAARQRALTSDTNAALTRIELTPDRVRALQNDHTAPPDQTPQPESTRQRLRQGASRLGTSLGSAVSAMDPLSPAVASSTPLRGSPLSASFVPDDSGVAASPGNVDSPGNVQIGRGFSSAHLSQLHKAMDMAERGDAQKALTMITRVRNSAKDPAMRAEKYVRSFLEKEAGCACKH